MKFWRRLLPVPTLGSPISDLELWSRAREQQRQHGEDAMAAAAQHMAELEEANDRVGYATWAAILLRIALLGPSMSDVQR